MLGYVVELVLKEFVLDRRLKPDIPESTPSLPVMSGRSPPGFNPSPRPKSPDIMSSEVSSRGRSWFDTDDITRLVMVKYDVRKKGSIFLISF